jgi:hypothetical protein
VESKVEGDYAEPICGVTWVSKNKVDPSSSECEEDPGHEGRHRGLSPFGKGYVTWEGGGMCAGDRVPARNVRFE